MTLCGFRPRPIAVIQDEIERAVLMAQLPPDEREHAEREETVFWEGIGEETRQRLQDDLDAIRREIERKLWEAQVNG